MQRIGTVLAAQGELVLARGGRDDARAHDLADLHRGESDATGGAEHQQRLPALQLRALLERVVRGARRRSGKHAAVVKSICGGSAMTFAASRHDLLGKAAVAGRIASTRMPVAMPLTPAPTCLMTPATSAPGENGSGGLGLVLALHDQAVEEVDAAGACTAISTSPGPAGARGHLVERELLERRELPREHRLHWALPLPQRLVEQHAGGDRHVEALDRCRAAAGAP